MLQGLAGPIPAAGAARYPLAASGCRLRGQDKPFVPYGADKQHQGGLWLWQGMAELGVVPRGTGTTATESRDSCCMSPTDGEAGGRETGAGHGPQLLVICTGAQVMWVWGRGLGGG